MSYILDALRRAQAERDRGQVPGLLAQPLAASAPGSSAARGPGPWLAAAAVLFAAALVALVAVLLLRTMGTARAPVAAGAAESPPPRPEPTAATPPPGDAPARLPVVVSAPSPRAPVAAPPAPAPRPELAAPAPVAAPPATAPAVVPMASLSAEQRRELPPLAVGGSVWSASKDSRFVIVNGQIVHEGESAAPGVTVEHIGPKSATLLWRGLHIELPF